MVYVMEASWQMNQMVAQPDEQILLGNLPQCSIAYHQWGTEMCYFNAGQVNQFINELGAIWDKLVIHVDCSLKMPPFLLHRQYDIYI